MRVRARVRLKGFFLVPKSHQHARVEVPSCLSFLDPKRANYIIFLVIRHLFISVIDGDVRSVYHKLRMVSPRRRQ